MGFLKKLFFGDEDKNKSAIEKQASDNYYDQKYSIRERIMKRFINKECVK